MAYSKGQWTEVTTDDGDVWVLAGDAKPGELHSYLIGNLEDTCEECHANAQLIVTAPKLYEALERIAQVDSVSEANLIAREALSALAAPATASGRRPLKWSELL